MSNGHGHTVPLQSTEPKPSPKPAAVTKGTKVQAPKKQG
jgi:hypothetical protein